MTECGDATLASKNANGHKHCVLTGWRPRKGEDCLAGILKLIEIAYINLQTKPLSETFRGLGLLVN